MKPKSIEFTTEWRSSGITIEYIKSRDVLNIRGWYDHFVGIEGGEMSVKEFCDKLGIDLKRARQ